ncbi:MAG: hypothetical protein ACK55I_20295, partial [bacterium]
DTLNGTAIEIEAKAIAGAGTVIAEALVVLYGYSARIVHPDSAGPAAVYVAGTVVECHAVLYQAPVGIAQYNSVAPDGIRIGYARIVPGSTMGNCHVLVRVADVIVETDVAVHQYSVPQVIVY